VNDIENAISRLEKQRSAIDRALLALPGDIRPQHTKSTARKSEQVSEKAPKPRRPQKNHRSDEEALGG